MGAEKREFYILDDGRVVNFAIENWQSGLSDDDLEIIAGLDPETDKESRPKNGHPNNSYYAKNVAKKTRSGRSHDHGR